mmetsp:Transcript_5533/g.8192  ORF Transcript_5533/g.8192 Transcript_5533/m.8192 type:complete len:237 (-) Transcript_5533:1079-1789(-)
MMPALTHTTLHAHLVQQPVNGSRRHHGQRWVQRHVKVGIETMQVMGRIKERQRLGAINGFREQLHFQMNLAATRHGVAVAIKNAVITRKPVLKRPVVLSALKQIVPAEHDTAEHLLLRLFDFHNKVALAKQLHAHRAMLVRPHLPGDLSFECHLGPLRRHVPDNLRRVLICSKRNMAPDISSLAAERLRDGCRRHESHSRHVHRSSQELFRAPKCCGDGIFGKQGAVGFGGVHGLV